MKIFILIDITSATGKRLKNWVLVLSIFFLCSCKKDPLIPVHKLRIDNSFEVYEQLYYQFATKTDTVLQGNKIFCKATDNYVVHNWFVNGQLQLENKDILHLEAKENMIVSHQGFGPLNYDMDLNYLDSNMRFQNIYVNHLRVNKSNEVSSPISPSIGYIGTYVSKDKSYQLEIKDSIFPTLIKMHIILYW